MNKTTFKGLLAFIFLCAFFSSSAQIQKHNLEKKQSSVQNKNLGFELTGPTKESIELTGYARCLTDEYEAALQKQFPNRATNEDFERWLAPKLAEIREQRENGELRRVVYNIPVVIHIIHDGDAIGTGENITDAQALSQIQVMNEDYRRMAGTPGGVNSTGVAVDVEINFCIAQQDENGNPSTGVVRHVIAPYSNNVTDGSGGADWETMSDVETMKTTTQWDPTRYLNMWTIRPGGLALSSGGLDGLLGYAQFPDNTPNLGGLSATGGAANTDGVVAAFDAMGTIAEDDGSFMLNGTYNLGRTMTHEVGHWLGLRHIWGDTSTCTGGATAGDYCADTPDSNQANYSCVTVDNCPTDGLGNDQVQNYMDYTPDACMDTFTQDQKDRMVAIMQSSPRRVELNSSNTCSPPNPTVYFNTSAPSSITEGSDCSFVDYTFDFSITSAGSESSVASFVPTGSAANNSDFELINNSVSFAAGATVPSGNSTITLRVYRDDFVEADETLTLTVDVATTGDAVGTLTTYQLDILNDDFVPVNTQVVALLDSNVETTDTTTWYVIDNDGDGNNFISLNAGGGTFVTGIEDVFFGSESDGTALGTGGNFTPDNFLLSDAITIPSDATVVTLSYGIGGYQDNEPYEVYWTTDNTSVATITGSNLIDSGNTLNNDGEIKVIDMLSFAGQTGYLSFRHISPGTNPGNGRTSGIFLLDNILLEATVSKSIQTAVNSGTTNDLVSLPTSGSVYTSDTATTDLMLDITNNNADDYGCVDVSVSRAGTSAQSYNGSSVPNYVADKTFTITPNNVIPTGNATIDFYFTEAEIAGWESVTGDIRNNIKIIKDDGSSTEVADVTITAFGSDVKLSGTFTTGINGTYYFGVPETLSNQEFSINELSIYPNPSNGEFTININTKEDVKLSVYDVRGRLMFNSDYNNTDSVFNKTIQLGKASTGLYIIKVQAGNKSAFKRMIVE